MSNNYIEEFFISIGFDTKKVKKESKEIDKLLDNIVGKKRQAVSDEVKLKKKLHTQTKRSETDNFKHFLKLEEAKRRAVKKTEEARRKQAVGMLTAGSGNRITSKTSMFSPIKEVKVVEKDKAKAQHERQVKRKKHRAELARKRLKEEEKANALAKKSLQERLKIHKANNKAMGIDREGSRKLNERFRNTATFRNAQDSGTLGGMSDMMDKAARGGQIEELRRLQHQMRKTAKETGKLRREQSKLNTVQKGLTDSTRNMVRSYASVFALFQGTVAIKRVGQEFEGMRSAMLAASGSAPAASKDLEFINDISQEMGLNLKDTTDAFVKFKFAAKGKMDNAQIEELFKSVSMFGTALKVAPDDMRRAQRAISQIPVHGLAA